MHEPTYRQALSHAWQAVWHHKIIWIFGLLSIFVGQFGANDFIGKIWMVAQRTLAFGKFQGLVNLDWKTELGLVWIALIAVGILLLVIFVSTIAQGALITSAAHSLRQQNINFTKAWHRGAEHFLPLLLTNILRTIAMTIIIVVTGYAWTFLVFSHLPALLSSLLSIIIFSTALFLGLSISSWSAYTLCYSVLDGKGFWSALKRGWGLFHHHLLVSLEMNIILFIILIGLSALLYGLFLLSAAPALILWLIAGLTGYLKLITFGLILWSGFVFLLIALSGALYNCFSVCVWVYLFLKMHNEGIASRIFHYFKKITGR